MAANDAATYANNIAIVEAVGRGEIDDGPRQPLLQRRRPRPRTPTCRPRTTSSPTATSAACCSSPRPSVVEGTRTRPGRPSEFVEFLLGEEAQEYFAEETFEYPLAAGVEPAAELPPLDVDRRDPQSTFDELGGELERTRELISESGLDG